jgi:hypothetical protein
MADRAKRAWRALKNRLATRAAILSDRLNPAEDEDRARQIKAERRWILWMSLLFGNGVVLMCTADSFVAALRSAAIAALNAAVAYLSFRNLTALKAREFSDKVKKSSKDFERSYEETLIRLAVEHPLLPTPSRRSYESAKRKADRVRRIRGVLSSKLSKFAMSKFTSLASPSRFTLEP